MDKARKKTDRLLHGLERRIEALYRNDPSLLRIQKKYLRYMAWVEKATRPIYTDFCNESNPQLKQELKDEYTRQIKALTEQSKIYREIINEFTKIMAHVNQKAMDLANAEMPDVYIINYNQAVEVCEDAGINVYVE